MSGWMLLISEVVRTRPPHYAKTHYNRPSSAATRNWSAATAKRKTRPSRSHYQIIWLLAQGKPSEEVASVTGKSRIWIYELVRGYNRVGPDMLGDLRHQNPGEAPLLDDVQQANLTAGVARTGTRWRTKDAGVK